MNCLVTNGNIYYDIVGSGFPILIIHSMGTDHRSMKTWIEPIFENIQGYQRIYIDLPAHGLSFIDENLKSSDDILLNILDFIDKTIPNQAFSLIGFSFGGYLAQGVLHQKHKKVKSICLLATALHLKERSLPKKIVFTKDEALLNGLDPDIRKAFETLIIYQNKENLSYFLNEIQPGRLLANKSFLMSNWRETGYFLSEEPFNDVSKLPHPALIILGKQDSICGYKDHFYLLEKFPNATFAILDQAGHMIQIEKRKIVQGLIKDWLIRSHAVCVSK
ncbi:alpha/beta fold hydrolase [Pseudoneobacillus rhizosphaerae]|uniref:2-succinyl-6-hydroxy-2, 4-cyclohexadiene-1-carboxylate synthase n=1 Tax=Pseudoneobacillus rhizosphaerae TaxID=2880968 RepID=A0A9C7LAR5_9BACI|nr:alpha/beta hydrolase [Pseudoneobacillus rhizosphaerae]CAG9609406.1 2-succinyl-6-hydroxy-2, 4-cyclohexadiene-1-carboxylate synthase [Pseudoneobacillus rhizosphaerae]